MSYQGDINLGDTFHFTFTSRQFSTGAPFTLAGTPTLAVYVENNTTQFSSGITLTTDFDGVTGLNHVTIEATAANGYSIGQDYNVILTAGTVDSVSVIGETIGSFSIENRNTYANIKQISDSTTAADNLELMYNGSGYIDDTAPASRSQLDTLAVGSAGISTVASTAVVASGSETLTYTATTQDNSSYHQVSPSGTTTDFYYQFDIGPNGVPVEIEWNGYAQSNGDNYSIYLYNWGSTSWEQVGSIAGANGTTETNNTFSATTSHVGTGANNGLVNFRIHSTDGTNFATDRILCTYTVINAAIGYELGRIWVDEINGTSTGTTPGVDGLITNRSNDFDNAQTIADALGYHDINVTNGNTITLTSALEGYDIYANAAEIVLNNQNVGGTQFNLCDVSGVGTSTSLAIVFNQCDFGNVNLYPFHAIQCGFGGTLTAGSAGNYYITHGYSEVAGTSSPTFDFTGLGSTTNINVRAWYGGGTWTLDSDCVASIEVIKGGGHTITTAGTTEFRGFCRSITLTITAGTTQIIAFTGPITINGSGGTVNVYGQHSGITDNSGGSVTINDLSVDGSAVGTNVAAILADTNELQTDLTDGGRLDLILDELTSQGDTNATLIGNVVSSGAATWTTSTLSASGVWAYANRALSTGTITANTFANNAITANSIAASAITANKIDTDAITSAKLAANCITSSELDGTAVAEIWNYTTRALTDKAGFSVSGTLTTLDALDTAQDSQHSITQSAIDNVIATGTLDWLTATGFSTTSDVNTAATSIVASGTTAWTSADFDTAATNIVASGTAAWGTATGFSTHSAADVRTEIDSNSTQLAAIVADTSELQGDWTNGGRLDLIIDELTAQGDTNAILISNVVASGTAAWTTIDAATIRSAIGLASANLDTQLSTIDSVVDGINVYVQTSGVTVATASKTGYSLSATGLDAVVMAEPASVVSLTDSIVDGISWLTALNRNKVTQTSTTLTLRNDADDANIATSTVSDDGTTATRGEFS